MLFALWHQKEPEKYNKGQAGRGRVSGAGGLLVFRYLGILVSSNMNASGSRPVQHVRMEVCGAFRRARIECWQRSLHGKGGEECLKEELLEKRCLARQFCPSQARKFYGNRGEADTGDDAAPSSTSRQPDRKGQLRDGDCSLWAESFAFGPNLVQKEVAANRKKAKQCSKISHNLSKCLAKFSLQNS